jgi:hypothetical protein
MAMTKLTLSVPAEIIGMAKAYSRNSGESLSQLVSRYFKILGQRGQGKKRPSDRIRKLTGVLKTAEKSDDDLLYEAMRGKYGLQK